ncbi:hypothetical protein AOLI_G00132660 [Acnodon oligacanthus]
MEEHMDDWQAFSDETLKNKKRRQILLPFVKSPKDVVSEEEMADQASEQRRQAELISIQPDTACSAGDGAHTLLTRTLHAPSAPVSTELPC